MSLTRTPICLLALVLSGLLPLPLRASSVVAPDFDSLVSQADYIVRAVVTDVTSEWRETDGNRSIITKVTLDVKEVIAGNPPSPLVLECLGGKVGSEEMIVTDAPKFYVGDEDILFIKGNGRMISPLVAMGHGRYPVLKKTKTGEDAVLRSNGVPLYEPGEVALPMAALSEPAQQLKTKPPLTPSEFAIKIRQSRAHHRPAP